MTSPSNVHTRRSEQENQNKEKNPGNWQGEFESMSTEHSCHRRSVASGLDSREKWPVTALPAQRHKLVIQCLAACHRNGNSIQIGSSAVDETHRIIWKMCAGGQRYMLQYCTTVNQRYIDCNLKWIKQSQHKRTMIRRLWGCECWPISPMRQNRRQWWPWHEAYYWVACTNQINPKA
jgi:hypothetical protein